MEQEVKSESRRSPSRTHSVRSRDLRNPDSVSDSSSHLQSFGIGKGDVPPMN